MADSATEREDITRCNATDCQQPMVLHELLAQTYILFIGIIANRTEIQLVLIVSRTVPPALTMPSADSAPTSHNQLVFYAICSKIDFFAPQTGHFSGADPNSI